MVPPVYCWTATSFCGSIATGAFVAGLAWYLVGILSIALGAGALAFVIAMFWVFARGSRGFGPEGPIGGWLIAIPPLLLIGLAAMVQSRKTDKAYLFGIVVMAIPMVQLVGGPVVSTFRMALKLQLPRTEPSDESARK